MGVTLTRGQTIIHYLRRALPYVGTGFIVWLLLRQIQLQDVWQLLRSAEWLWVMAGFGWYFVTNICRAYRFAAFLAVPGRGRPLRLIPEMILLSFLNNALPARAGEFSFPLLMQRRHGLPVAESAALLLVVRIFDFLAVAGLYVLFVLLQRIHLAPAAGRFVTIIALMLGAALLCLASLPWWGQQILIRIRRGLVRIGRAENGLGKRLLAFGDRAMFALRRVHQPQIYLRVFFWSILGWLTTFAWFTSFLHAMALPASYPLVIVGATFATLAKAIPFITVGGFGAHDAGWAFGFTLVGFPAGAAIASGFAVNLLTLVMSFLFSVLAFFSLPYLPSLSNETATEPNG